MNSAPMLLLCSLLLLCPPDALAQTRTAQTQVYRCGMDGRDLRDSPCPDGTAQPAQALRYDRPSAEQQKATRQQTRDDAQLARQMRQDRLHQEDRDRRLNARAAGISTLTPSKAAADKAAPAAAKPKPGERPQHRGAKRSASSPSPHRDERRAIAPAPAQP